tara:strand:+ start:181 stop:291 length:111 start_codon:yes stop_codon:yes gene_type:complete
MSTLSDQIAAREEAAKKKAAKKKPAKKKEIITPGEE